jgi:uncharacterized membrane protein
MIKPYLVYNNQIIKLSLFVSLLVTFLAVMLNQKEITFSGLIRTFLIGFLTGGFLSGVLFYNMFRKKEYYFFYNLGISKLRLILVSYLFHLVISLPLFIFSLYAKHP